MQTQNKQKPVSIEEVKANIQRLSDLTADETYESIRALYHHNALAINAGKGEQRPFSIDEKMQLFRKGNQNGVERWKNKK